MKPFARFLAIAGSTLGLVSVADARPPHVSYIFPAGGQRGTTVDFKVGGHFLHEGVPFRMDGPGVEPSPRITRGKTLWFEGPVIPQPPSQRPEDYPVDYDGSIKIAPDAKLSAREWSVSSAQGVTVPMKFVIGLFPEFVEDEIQGTPLAQLVPLPVTINGRTFPREDVDLWSFDLAAGQTLTCLVTAQEIDSPVEAHLELRDPSGKRVAEVTGGLGQDPALRFTAKTAGRYAIQINDANFGGLQHHVYRLTLTTGAVVDSVFPLGGRRGETLKLQLTGSGLDRTTLDLPIAANGDETFVWRPDFAASKELGFALEASDHPELIESATANNATDSATVFAVPSVLNGRIEAAGDVDLWKFAAKKGEQVLFEVHASVLGSDLDSVITVLDAEGKQLVEADDSGPDIDARQIFNVPADGTYFVKIADRVMQRGGPTFGYRLHALDAKTVDSAPFSLELQSPRVVNVDRDGELKLRLNVKRQNFNEAIELTLEGLPPGVAVDGASVPAKQNNATITLKADAKTPLSSATVRILGKAKVGDVERQAVATVRTNPPTPEKLDRLLMAVTLKTPFKFVGQFESKFAARGSVYFRHYTLDRGGFEGPIEISLADRQNRHLQGVTGSKIVIPAGVNEFDFPAVLPPWLEVGRTSRTCLMAVGEMVDADGTKHKVTFSSQEQNDQIIVLTAPEEFSIVVEVPSIRAVPGESATIPLQVGRASHLKHPAIIEIVPAKHIQGTSAERLTVTSDVTKTALKVNFAKGPIGPFNVPLLIRATTMDDRSQPVTFETSIDVVTDADEAPVVQAKKTAK